MARRSRAQTDDAQTGRRRNWTQMGDRKYYAEQLRQIHADLDGARQCGSWQALAALHRQAMQMRERLDEIDRERKRPAEAAMTEDELVAILVDAIRNISDTHLDLIEEEVVRRRGPSLADAEEVE